MQNLIIMILKIGSGTLFILLIIISPVAAHVHLLNPNGGETYNPGEIIQIEWQEVIRHETLNWDILFSSDGGISWDTVKSNIPLSSMNYSWELPGISTQTGRIKIVQDNVYEDYEDISDDFNISSVTGAFKPEKYEELKIYPNPITEYSLIEFDNPGKDPYNFTLYNSHGQLVRTLLNIRTNRIPLDPKNLPDGIYFFQLSSITELYLSGKFIIK